MTGGSSITPGGESFITDINTGTRIRQIVVGPATGLPTGALPEKEIHFGNGKYSKRRRSNVAVIHVRIVVISSFLFYCLLLNHSY